MTSSSNKFLKHVVQEKTRIALNLFRKSSRWMESFKEGNLIINSLNCLRNDLRETEGDLKPSQIFTPFLEILRAPQLSGPFMATALDAIQTFLSCHMVLHIAEAPSDLLLDVIETVSRCRFVLTDKLGDQLVKISCVQVLHDITRSSFRNALSDEAAWALVDSCFTLLKLLGSQNTQSQLYQITEKTLLDSVRFIFSSISHQSFGQRDTSSSKTSFGLPCAMKIMGFFVGVINRCAPSSQSVGSASESSGSTGSSDDSGEVTRERLDVEQELILAIKTIQALLSSNGNVENSRKIILQCPVLTSLVRDDLSRSVVMLAVRRSHSSQVLQHVLSLYASLYHTFGPVLKVLIECFSLYVHSKALHQLMHMLELQHEQQQKGVISPGAIVTEDGQFSIDELEMIFDSFVDFLGNSGFMSSLYCSFDCDPTKPDILRPMFQYISKCSSFLLSSPGSPSQSRRRLKTLYTSASMTVKCLVQASKTLSKRCGENLNVAKHDHDWQIFKQKHSEVLHFPKHVVKTALEHRYEQKIGTFYRDLNNCSPQLISQKLQTDVRSKMILREAGARFATKPKSGLIYLQEIGALETPMTAFSCARFLRVACGLGCLPKDAAGAYLGELGKEEEKGKCHESEKIEFHKEVLHHYVQSFEFEAQGFMNCIRIFLSAFRLPGEAAQIDRILMAFSDYAIANSLEGQSGLLQNIDVGYLLSFSIIMLNTDAHNPSIRPDRKMTMEQFVRYNTNYGSDIKQTIDIPRDFLEGIYNDINNVPLRTEKNDLHGTLTNEMWMEYQLQTQLIPEAGFMLTTTCSPEVLVDFVAASKHSASKKEGRKSVERSDWSHTHSDEQICGSVLATYQLLNTDTFVCPLKVSSCIFGASWLVDAGLIDCLWIPLLTAAISPFLRQEHQPPPTVQAPVLTTPERPSRSSSLESVSSVGTNGSSANSVSKTRRATLETARVLHPSAPESSVLIGKDLLLYVVKLCHSQNTSAVVDVVVMLLTDIAGLGKGETIDAIVQLLKPLGPLSHDLHAGIGYLHESVTVPIDFKKKRQERMQQGDREKKKKTYRKRYSESVSRQRQAQEGGDSKTTSKSRRGGDDINDEDMLPYHVSTEYLATLMTFPPALVALRTLIQIAIKTPAYIGAKGWATIWHVMGVMRDLTALPPAMVCTDEVAAGLELLHPKAREDFESQMAVNRARELIHLREPSLQAQLRALTKTSVLSFQGLGNALFGGNNGEGSESWVETELILRQDQERKAAIEGLQSVVAGRWDAGYFAISESETVSSTDLTLSDDLSFVEFSYAPPPFATEMIEEEGWQDYVCELGRDTILTLRKMMIDENVEQLISDSKFFEDNSMMFFLDALCRSAERESLIFYSTSDDGNAGGMGDSADGYDYDEIQDGHEREDFVHITLPPVKNDGDSSGSCTNTEGEKGLLEIQAILERDCYLPQDSASSIGSSVSAPLPLPTEASASWLEVVVVEIALRNRDRMTLIWPLLVEHYTRAFALDGVGVRAGINSEHEHTLPNYNASRRGVEVMSGDGMGVITPIKLSRTPSEASNNDSSVDSMIIVHSIDRRVASVFKIVTRMMSRKQLIGPSIDLISAIFGSVNVRDEKDSNSKSITTHMRDSFTGHVNHDSIPMSLTPSEYTLYQISGQIASGMWMMLTQNVLTLPFMELHQWQAIFDIMSIAAKGSAYAAIKCFESMAWLIHEPNLRAEVPVFCVQAVIPLVLNPNAPDSVAIGALHLLLHLHGRLEVLLKDSETASAEGTPALWESCWIPILRAISLGAVDKTTPARPKVKRCAVNVLCATILDRHASIIPISVLVKVMQEVVIPTANEMGRALVKSVQDGTYKSTMGAPDSETETVFLPEDEYNLSKELYSKSVGNFRDIDNATSRHQLLTGGNVHAGSTAALLQIIKKVSLMHMHRLVQYPNFEVFWKDLLGVFTYYLDAAPPLGLGFNSQLVSECPELEATALAATTHLKDVLPVLKNSDYFVTSSSGGLFGGGSNSYSSNSYNQLWIITRQATGGLERCPNLFNEMFPGA
mmetsp:Transcript_5922/g.9632  ORF Transcript_5922/g.9632 Transcript_5922/m.9632 type:complete len:2029 (-) Transcript_5922:706-6792(-)|eukprot:CAMPEP_0114415976 /NCGR_PEP_ID=MMETSP0103-20121206/2193_1 /TAXON_ID=37642 ORGANISM="Paraphysomonas imperforata, Strain PA2" /NCGR_SAMPLE_ID=MMETSP0103 /ASSEMBLY_ACC=CAM_ASM_000201 /LENGTH=2028 /DNA_ID=CAMNT_0001584189 /DNA_START=76 /DNA_END=6162 /DNA_ORIENTATION=-